MNVVLLDLEGVFFVSGDYWARPQGYSHPIERELRPYSHELLDFLKTSVDRLIYNTCLDMDTAYAAMRNAFGMSDDDAEFWFATCSNKALGYEGFVGQTFVHIEDGIPERDLHAIQMYGGYYIQVSSFGISADIEVMRADRELRTVKKTLQEILDIR